MREKVKDRGRLEHILEAINEIQEYKSQYTLEDVKNSKLVFYGFTKFVEVIGEAVYMLTKEFRASHPGGNSPLARMAVPISYITFASVIKTI